MKKLTALTLGLVMAFGIMTGCSAATQKVYKIGIVQPMDHTSLNQIRDTIISELKALETAGKVEIITKNANGDSSMLPTIMQELISGGVDLIVPIATPSAQAAAAATKTIPIVFSAVSNPIQAKLVTSFEDTSGNITGVSNAIAIEDIFALAGKLTPAAKTFGLVYNSSEINSSVGIERAKAYCDKNGLKYKEVTITGTADLQQAATSLIGSVDAFFTPNDNTVASAMPTYSQLAIAARLPIYAGADSMVKDGALATVGIDYTVLGKQTAAMVTRIYNGETIKGNQVEQISKYSNMINLKTADAIGITVPAELKDSFIILGQ